MTELSMTLAEYLRKINVDLDGDFLHEGMRLLAERLRGAFPMVPVHHITERCMYKIIGA